MPIKDRANLDWKTLPFGYLKAGINVRYVWRDGKWDDGIETDDEYIPLHIAATCMHYGQAAFEGLKIYETRDGRVLSFRVEENAKRMAHSAAKMMMQAPASTNSLSSSTGTLRSSTV